MVDGRMAVAEAEQEIADIETANFILLSLYREYSVRMLNNPSVKDDCINKMRQIKYDLRHLTRKELLVKVEKLYKPVLQKMGDNKDYGK